MIKLRPYQQPLYDQIAEGLKEYDKILAQAETGWGKSILIGHLANTIPGRTLILTHRIELLNQNSEWIEDLGILTAQVKKTQQLKESKNVISMAQTLAARIKKYGPDYIGEFDNVIVDEVHVDFFKKVYLEMGIKKVIAMTATPIVDKKETKLINEREFVRKLSLKDDFDVLYQGVTTKELIELGFLTRDFNVQLTPPKLENLVSSSTTPDGYTSKSMSEVFGSSASLKTVFKGYLEYCKGKKTIIFNPTTKVNKEMFEEFQKSNINCKMFDSVNKIKGQTRKDVVDWFKSNDDAVLLNVGVFTTGFSVNDLECIIYNKKTKSLSLWLQSIGRGSRIVKAPKIKDKFLVLDMGLNIAEHGKWSDTRNWHEHFILHDWKPKREIDLLRIWECKECGEFNIEGTFFNQELERIECNECHEPKPKREPQKKLSGKFVVLEEPVYPQAKKLVDHAIKVGGDKNMVNTMAKNMIIDLFIFHTSKDDFEQRRSRYINRIAQLYRPVYFSLISTTKLTGKNRRLETELQSIITKLESLYT